MEKRRRLRLCGWLMAAMPIVIWLALALRLGFSNGCWFGCAIDSILVVVAVAVIIIGVYLIGSSYSAAKKPKRGITAKVA